MTETSTAPRSSTLAALVASRGAAIMAHRGTPGVAVVENTARAAIAAVLSGADIIEIDVTGSADGIYFAFHDGEEERLLGRDVDLLTLSSREIRQFCFARVSTPSGDVRIETIDQVLSALWRRFPDTLVNLDRSWNNWPDFLQVLDGFERGSQLILKSPVVGGHLEHLQDHPVKYPYVGICRTIAEVEIVLALADVNVVGVELLAPTDSSPFLDPTVLASFRDRGALLIANAEVLPGGPDLFAGHDDDESIFGTGPGWNRLLDLGFDVIQTDWPWLLRESIEKRRASTGRNAQARVLSP
ncbi:MAG: glycerophosphodiester phosphodiesterase family protein [Glaciihabitans sp.]|nr:glycerophosphodiester phosphodiesterase family protein [Glaciihabitans sp.]